MRLLHTIRIATLLVLGLASLPAFTQGGQGPGGGFGGGMGGGGFQGGSGQGQGEVFSKQLFLSPSDRTEWDFDAKPNDAVRVSVTSQVFDPAVKVVDDKGKVVAENDDLEPGNQMAQLMVVVPAPGKYKVVVSNYKGTAGGAFELNVTRMRTVPLKMGESTRVTGPEPRPWGSIKFERPGRFVVVCRGRPGSMFEVMDPTGQIVRDVRSVLYNALYQRSIVGIDKPGAYLIRGVYSSDVQLKVMPLTTSEMKVGESVERKLAEDEVQVVRVPVHRGDVLRVTITGSRRLNREIGSALDLPMNQEESRTPIVILQGNSPDSSWVTILGDGSLGIGAFEPSGAPSDVKISVQPAGQPWPASTAPAPKLNWYETDVWTFDGKPGDVITLRASASNFVPFLGLVDPNGEQAYGNLDGTPPTCKLVFQVKSAGKHVVYVHAAAAGPYTLDRKVVAPRALMLGENEGKVTDGSEVWRFSAKAGQDLAIRISSSALNWRVTLTGPDGKAISVIVRSVGSDLLRFTPPAAGDYQVTVVAEDDTSGAYQLKVVDLNR